MYSLLLCLLLQWRLLKTIFNEPTVMLFMIKKYLQLLFMPALTLLLLLVYCITLLLPSSFFFFFLLHLDGPLVFLYFGEDRNTKSVTKVPFQ